jgi:hypothetical protein
MKGNYNGKNSLFDQPSPENQNHLNLVIVNSIRWSTKIGRGSRERRFFHLTSATQIPQN